MIVHDSIIWGGPRDINHMNYNVFYKYIQFRWISDSDFNFKAALNISKESNKNIENKNFWDSQLTWNYLCRFGGLD